MSDSEDENYVKFGAPLEPLDADNLPRKRAITAADQCVYDAEGRRRFHGAFTGGFSAGYFNGVGSRDGWTPKRFKSSRAERTVGVVQRPQDFMDEEDTGQFGIAPTAIRTTGGYQDLDKDRKDATRKRQAQNDLLFQDGPIPGAPVLGEVLRPARDTVGVILLKKMGWRPGQGVGARITRKEKMEIRKRNKRMKVYGCSRPPGEELPFSTSTDESGNDDDAEDDDDDDEHSMITFAPDDYEPFRRDPKDNLFGIGYTGLDRRAVLSDSCDRRTLLAESFFRQEKDRKIAKHGRAFGVGAFEEEDEDIYAPDDMSRYDFTLAPEDAAKKSTKSKQRVPTGAPSCLEGFVKANYTLYQHEVVTTDLAKQKTSKPRKFFPPPVLPADFNPVHATSRFSPCAPTVLIGKRPISNAGDRALMLDEKSPSTSTNQRKTVESSEGRKEERKSESKSVASWMEKLQGGQTFVTGGLLTKPTTDVVEEEEKEEEKKETTSKLEEVNFPTVDDSVEDSRRKAARLKMFGKLTRERREWRACSIVCKRFNIQESKGDGKLESGVQKRTFKFSLLSKSIDFQSAAKTNKDTVLPAKATNTGKTEMQLVEEANTLQNQDDQNVETKASSSADSTASMQASVPTPFEVSYEKIFGKVISEAEVGRNSSESSERKDLFKAIFLDSDSDGDDDNEKKEGELNEEKDKEKRNDERIDEEEAMKSVLIGSAVEVKPSFSPPSGIFSNLDKLERPKPEKKVTELETVTEKECDEKPKITSTIPSLETLPENTYGPALPATLTNNHCTDQKLESSNRQVFKSVVIPPRSGSKAEERWVELKKSKKSKKEKKKKRKHKESKKSKKDSNRRKRHSRADV